KETNRAIYRKGECELKNIGILGGTFDPPHIGHLIIAEAVRERISLEKVWFMPSYEPPHKQNAYSSVGHRLNMLELSLRDNPYFSINEIETKRHEKSYTEIGRASCRERV